MKKRRALLATAIIMFALSAFATGAKDGGGGGVVVCPQSDGSKRVRLLDMVEVSDVTSAYKGEYRTQISHILQKLQSQGYRRLVYALRRALDFKLVPELSRLAHDAGPHLQIPANCSLQWVAFFDDTRDELAIDQQLFAMLSEDDRAALILHEAVYKVARQSGSFESDSRRVRRTVRLLIQNRNLNANDWFDRRLR